MYDKAILKYISLNDSNRIYCKVTKNFGFISSFNHRDDIFSKEFIILKNEAYKKIKYRLNNYHICIKILNMIMRMVMNILKKLFRNRNTEIKEKKND